MLLKGSSPLSSVVGTDDFSSPEMVVYGIIIVVASWKNFVLMAITVTTTSAKRLGSLVVVMLLLYRRPLAILVNEQQKNRTSLFWALGFGVEGECFPA